MIPRNSDRWIPSRGRINDGCLVLTAHIIPQADRSEWTTTQLRVTARGLAKLADLMPRQEKLFD